MEKESHTFVFKFILQILQLVQEAEEDGFIFCIAEQLSNANSLD